MILTVKVRWDREHIGDTNLAHYACDRDAAWELWYKLRPIVPEVTIWDGATKLDPTLGKAFAQDVLNQFCIDWP